MIRLRIERGEGNGWPFKASKKVMRSLTGKGEGEGGDIKIILREIRELREEG